MTLALLSNPNQTSTEEIERQHVRSLAPNDREPQVTMRVQKRNGSFERVDVNKIVRAVARCSVGLTHIDPLKIATKTIGGLYDGATTKELDTLSIQTAAQLIAEETEYSKLAARLLATFIDKEVANQDIHSFSQSIAAGLRAGLIADRTAAFVTANSRKLNDVIEAELNDLFEYFGLRTLYDRYLLRDPQSRQVIETPQYFFMRVACGLAENVGEALEFYSLLSSFEYMVSSPTLFNSGTRHPQMSSCYLLDSPRDNLEAIYGRYTDVAKLSKFSGGIGLAYHRVRSRGSLIQSTNGLSNGIVPWLKTLDSSVAAVNQGGKTARRLLQLSGNLARRHRGVFGVARQHRRWRPAHSQLEFRQLGAGPFHETGRRGRSLVAFRSQGRAAISRSLRPRVRGRLCRSRSKCYLFAPGESPRSLSPHDEDPRRNGKWLDHVQRYLQRPRQSDRQAGKNGAFIQPLHGNRRDNVRCRNRRLQFGIDQSREVCQGRWF
jgi:hypothetical protein